jgi:hypothetical protein
LKGGREEKGGRRMGGYQILTIEEATVDGHGCVGDDEEDDRMLVGGEEFALESTFFGAWRNVTWTTVTLLMLYRSIFIPGVRLIVIKTRMIWSTTRTH